MLNCCHIWSTSRIFSYCFSSLKTIFELSLIIVCSFVTLLLLLLLSLAVVVVVVVVVVVIVAFISLFRTLLSFKI